MIDCHAHAFPDTDRQLQRLALGDPLAQLVGPASRLAGPLGDHLSDASTLVNLTIEKLAAFRRQSHPLVHGATEFFLTLGIGGPVMLCGTLDRLTASMDRHGFTHTAVIAAPPLAPNAWLLEEAARDPRIVPVANQPDLELERPLDDWVRAWVTLAEQGARGFKIHPNVSGLDADHRAHRAAFRAAEATGRFVILHTGRFAAVGYRHLRPADPREYLPLFEAHPGVPVCLAHMNRDEPEVVWELMRGHEQLWTDTSWQPGDVLRRALDRVGTDRVLLGSDWPLLHTDLQGDALDTLKRVATDPELDRITDANARAFLRLP